MKHQEHIVCVKASKVNRPTSWLDRLAFWRTQKNDGFVDYTPTASDIFIGQRAELENDPYFRQIIPVSVFRHQGKIWAYERTTTGGESRLHNKVAVAVGGHWDMTDIVSSKGVIDLEASIRAAMERELAEEVRLGSVIIGQHRYPKMICANDTEVDRVHLGMVWINDLDSQDIEPNEDQLNGLGFFTPAELLTNGMNLEPWAKIICTMLKEDKSA